MNYQYAKVTFQEIPDEITLCIAISGCKVHCKDCNQKNLWKDEGKDLNIQELDNLINANKGITCVCIMGGDANPSEVDDIAQDIKEYYPNLKVGWYSGRQELNEDIELNNFDFIKLGPYKEEFGPLNSRTTNQRFYKVNGKELVDITSRFYDRNLETCSGR